MKRLISIIVSFAIVLLVWSTLDRTALMGALAGTDQTLLLLSLALLVVLVMASGLRLVLLAKVSAYELDFQRGVRATFVANTLNMVLPSKLGDVLKAATLAKSGSGNLAAAFALGAWEKLVDLVMLFVMAAICSALIGQTPLLTVLLSVLATVGFAVALLPACLGLPLKRLGGKGAAFANAWQIMIVQMRSKPKGLAAVLLLSGLIWLGHIAQIALMILALGAMGDLAFWGMVIAQIPLVVVAGLVPLTFAGIGTRDAAIVALYAPLIGGATAGALGILFWLRYLVPGLIGLPFLRSYGADVRGHLMEAKKVAFKPTA